MRPFDLLVGAVFAGVVALVAWRARAVTRSGAVAAFVVGTLTYASGTVAFALVLLAFFVSSVVLSRVGRGRKGALVDVGKHGARDALQVLANGGVATACATAFAFTLDVRWAVAFAGAYAAATADTWATEVGTLSKRPPRSILNLKPMPAGLSGGITLAGTAAEIAGALFIGLAAYGAPLLALVFGRAAFGAVAGVAIHTSGVAIIALAGVAGATMDSLLGATIQELRRCDVCKRTCETDPHACGSSTRLVRGIPGASNDLVNFAATLTGALVALALVSATL